MFRCYSYAEEVNKMTQGERIKVLRKELGLTLERFGVKVGVGKTAISKLEKGENNVTDQMAKSICREFNVSYAWLIDGVGEMYENVAEEVLRQAKMKYDLDELDVLILEKYIQLPADKRKIVKEYIMSIVAEELKKQQKDES